MNYSSLRRVLFSSLSHPSPALTSAVLLLLSLSLCSSHWTVEGDFTIELLFCIKGTTCWRSTAGTEASCYTPQRPPPHKPDGLQIELGKRRLHAGQRLWGHVTCHAAFCTSFIMDRCSWIIHNRVVTDEDASMQQISSMRCALLQVFSLQIVHFIYI